MMIVGVCALACGASQSVGKPGHEQNYDYQSGLTTFFLPFIRSSLRMRAVARGFLQAFKTTTVEVVLPLLHEGDARNDSAWGQ